MAFDTNGIYPNKRAEVIQVIHTLVLAGSGTDPNNPAREVDMYWTFDGKLIGIIDSFMREETSQ